MNEAVTATIVFGPAILGAALFFATGFWLGKEHGWKQAHLGAAIKQLEELQKRIP